MKLLWPVLWIILCAGAQVVQAHGHHRTRHRKRLVNRLFVFGDSYADTGNIERSLLVKSWNYPYGVTFPGKPTGRFSDGRVLTDFVARFADLVSPVPYRWRFVSTKLDQYGMNFAYGGTGVFDTYSPFPNVSAQIDLFEQVIKKEHRYNPFDIKEAMALISVAGNDYISWYQQNNGSLTGISEFIESVVSQLLLDVSRLAAHMKRVAVVTLPPLGCVPFMTIRNSYRNCSDLINMAAMYHNQLLQEGLRNMTAQQTKLSKGSKFIVLDLYSSFMSIIQSSMNQGESKFGPDILKPCCAPVSTGNSCGDVDEKGNKLYTLCEDPESAFFWDNVHPTQMGWTAVSAALERTFQSLSG